MILIADSGATKTHWVLIDGKSVLKEIYTVGFNPYYYPTEEFERSLEDVLKESIPDDLLTHVYFYGSGISSKANVRIVEKAILRNFPQVEVNTYHDLTGAAVALLGNEKGVACILGTGSNSCLWDGEKVVANVPSLGYFLGDEGSGTYIGKLLVRDVLLGNADPAISKLFYELNELNFSKTLDRIYKEEHPNRFFAEQTRFLRNHLANPYVESVITKAFSDFVNEQLLKYEGIKKLPVCFTGSIAANFTDILEKVLTQNGLKMGKIRKEPMEGMIEYYLGKMV
jgi:N-acetylglucosamine kinase-like BadF-type ATPase